MDKGNEVECGGREENLWSSTPGLVAIMGMPLHYLPYDHGRLALDETPYPPSAKSLLMKYINIFLFI